MIELRLDYERCFKRFNRVQPIFYDEGLVEWVIGVRIRRRVSVKRSKEEEDLSDDIRVYVYNIYKDIYMYCIYHDGKVSDIIKYYKTQFMRFI